MDGERLGERARRIAGQGGFGGGEVAAVVGFEEGLFMMELAVGASLIGCEAGNYVVAKISFLIDVSGRHGV